MFGEIMEKIEIEIKAYCKDTASVKQRLEKLGAIFVKTKKESDRYFNHPAKDFGKTDEALRLRTDGDITILTYKGPKISEKSKARIEKEVGVHGDEETGEILNHLGFREVGKVVKKRDYYKIDDITICLDEVEGLGSFVELEKIGENVDISENELFKLAGKLGLKKFERKSYLELILKIF